MRLAGKFVMLGTLLLTLTFMCFAEARAAVDLELAADSASVAVGSEVTVTVKATGTDTVGAVDVKINFDHTKVQIKTDSISSTLSGVTKPNAAAITTANGNGVITIPYADAAGFTPGASGTEMAVIIFTTTASGNIIFDLDDAITITATDFSTVTGTLTDEPVTITGTTSTVDATLSTITVIPPTGSVPANGTDSFLFTITAKDSTSTPVGDKSVVLTATSSDGGDPTKLSFTPATGTTDSVSGEATITVSSSSAGTFTVTATVDGVELTTKPNIVFDTVQVASFTVTGIPDPATAGTANTVTVTALDASGNTDTSYTGTIAFSSTDSAATLPVNYTFVAGDSGVKTFTVTLNTVATSQTVTVTDTTTSTMTGSQTVAVQAAPVAHFEVTGIPDPATAGTANTVTVTALDASGNTDTAYTGTVAFSSTDSAATLPANYTFVAGDSGVKTFTVTLNTVATSQTVTVTDTTTSTMTGSQTVAVQAAPVAHFEVTGIPDPATAGTANTVTVTALDASGNTDTAYTGTVAFSSTDSAATLPANYTFVAGDSGVKTFTVTLNTVATSQTVTVTDTTTSTMTGSQTVAVQASTTDTQSPLITKVMSNGLDITNGNTLVTLDPNTSLASVNIIVSASDATTGGSKITKAEYYLDSPDPGEENGTPVTFTTDITVSLIFDVTGLDFSTGHISSDPLTPGHEVNIRVMDEVGKWSIISTVTVLVLPAGNDTSGPVIYDVKLNGITPDTATTPNTLTATAGATPELTATVSDATTGSSVIKTVIYTIDGSDPTTSTTAQVMTAVDGTFDEITEEVKLSLDLSTYTAGQSLALKLAGQDSNDIWGTAIEYTINICASAANFTYVINATNPMAIDFDLTGTDAGTGGTAMLDYGDGSAVADVTGSTSASHTYATAGTYHVILTATDVSGCAVKMEKDIAVTGTAPVKGDANCDGKVDIFDALIIAEYDVLIIKTDILTNAGFGCADLATFKMNADIVADLNGEPNIFDALAIADCDSKSTDPATVASCVAAK